MPVKTNTIEVPFDTGLSQKVDQQWLEAGSSSTALNLIRSKQRALAKRLGLRSLSNTALVSGQNGGGGSSNSVSIGSRLLSRKTRPHLLGTDRWPQALFAYDETSSSPRLIDRIPEVYASPYELISGSQGGVVYQMDVAVANGYEFIVWLDPAAPVLTGTINYAIRSAATGTVVIPPQQYSTGLNFTLDICKVIACGTSFVMTYCTPNADNNVYATVFDSTRFGTTNTLVIASGRINTQANDSVQNNGSLANPYDVCPVIGDTTKFGLIYEATRAGTRTIRIVVYNVSGLTVSSDTAIDSSDTTWTTDNGVSAAASQLTALALRVDSGNSEAAYAYAWRNTTPLTRVSAGIRNYTAMTSKATPINLMATVTGSMSASTDKAPALVTIERNPNNGNYSIRTSPGASVYDQGSAQLPYIAAWQGTTNAGAFSLKNNQPRLTYGAALWSRDFVQNGISYFIGYTPSSTQTSFFVFADDYWQDYSISNNTPTQDPFRLVANLAVRLGNPLVLAVATPSQTRVAPHFVANPNAAGGLLAQSMIPIATTASSTAPAKTIADFASTLLGQSAELGGNVLIACGTPSITDGSQVFEMAFPIYPVILSVTTGGTTGHLSAGTYNWIAEIEYVDASGQRHRSARSAPFTATAAATNNANVTVALFSFSSKVKVAGAAYSAGPQGGLSSNSLTLSLKIYRTQVNASPTVYNNVIANDAAVDQVNWGTQNTQLYQDGAADTTIVSNALLYSDGSDGTSPGNILDNLCAPAAQGVFVYNNRGFWIEGRNIWPTKAFTTGEGAGVNEATAFSVDDGPGNVLAGAQMDDKMLLFKGDRLFYMTGQGPADNGTQNDWTPPQRISSDVGIVDWRSLVVTPKGAFFMSPAGRRLLTRDLQVVPISNVEDIDAQYPVVTSATLHPSSNRVIWTQCTDDVSTPRSGVIVVYDYILDTWTTHAFNDNAGHATCGFVSATVANAQTSAGPPAVNQPCLHLLRADGTMMREDIANGTSLDTATAGGGTIFVPMTWSSPWIKSEGLLGWSNWGFLRILTRSVDPANFTVTINYNYPGSPLSPQTKTFTAPQTTTFPGLFEMRITENRAAALQVTVTDASGTGTTTGAGFVLVGMRLDYDVDTGGYRAPSGQRG